MADRNFEFSSQNIKEIAKLITSALTPKVVKSVTKSIIENLNQTVKETVWSVVDELEGKRGQNTYKDKTIKHLKAYPFLKENINKYEKDIADIFKEEFGTCSAVHHAIEYYGDKLTVDEIRNVKKLQIEHMYYKDMAEVEKIEWAIKSIDGDEYASIIPMIYFDKMRVEDVADKLGCDKATLYRNRNRLLDILKLKFFGAKAID